MKFPHPLALLTGGIALAAALTGVLPAGQYERRRDEATGREVVMTGTYHRVDASPVGPFRALVAIPRGLIDAADVIFLVLLVGGAFVVVEKTGALAQATAFLADRLRDRSTLVIPVIALFFATGGALQHMAEEIIPLIPVLLILMRQLGFPPTVAALSSLGAAAVGAAFSPIDPFLVGIAQKLAAVDLGSGWQFRLPVLALALALWIGATMRYARRERVAPAAVASEGRRLDGRTTAILLLIVATFAIMVVGLRRWDWDFPEMAALFFLMGVVAGLLGRLGTQGTASAFAEGFAAVAYAAALIGFARAIAVVLNDGRVIDTIVHGMFTPLGGLPVAVSALGMMAAHVAIHVPVPSVSGQAVLTMPVLVPLSDLVGLSRQVTVLAYQYGAGLTELFTPTNGALMAVLAAAGVSYQQWLKVTLTWILGLFALAAGAILIAIAIGVS